MTLVLHKLQGWDTSRMWTDMHEALFQLYDIKYVLWFAAALILFSMCMSSMHSQPYLVNITFTGREGTPCQ